MMGSTYKAQKLNITTIYSFSSNLKRKKEGKNLEMESEGGLHHCDSRRFLYLSHFQKILLVRLLFAPQPV